MTTPRTAGRKPAAATASTSLTSAARKLAAAKPRTSAAVSASAERKTAAAKARTSAASAERKTAAAKPRTALTAGERAKAVAGATTTLKRLREIHPDAHCELDHRSAFELLVATVLSAQTTDVLVNKVTPHLFAKYPDAKALGAADPAEVGALLRERGLGMYNQKAKNIVGLARGLVERHGAQVPRSLAELIELPGVGRKTANVVLGVAFGAPEGVVVDTHVMRISQRLGWTNHTEPPEIEADLCKLFPRSEWDILSHTLIFHGRRVCAAVKPACAACGVSELCPSAYQAELIGRKPPRPRA